MTPRPDPAIQKLEELQKPKKPRRTAQEQAIDLLVKKRQSLMDRHTAYLESQKSAMDERVAEHKAKTDAEIVGVNAAIEALRKAAEVTDETPPHDAEYREQRRFEALLQTATNGQLRDLLRNPEQRTTWELAAVHAELSRRTL